MSMMKKEVGWSRSSKDWKDWKGKKLGCDKQGGFECENPLPISGAGLLVTGAGEQKGLMCWDGE